MTNRPKCNKCNAAPADVVENDTEYSCARCWLDTNVKGKKHETK